MANQNSAGQQYANNADGFELQGGTTPRKLTVTSADVTLSDLSLTAGAKVFTYPSATDVLVGRASTDTLTNKTVGDSLTIASISEPSAPASDFIKLYAGNRAGKMLLRIKGPSGIDTPLQPALFANSQVLYTPGSGTAIPTNSLGAVFTSAGTVAHPTPSSTSPTYLNSMRRTQWTSGTTTSTPGGIFTAIPQVWSGNAAGLGGYMFFVRFGMTTATANNRAFIGLCSQTTGILAANVNPSTVASHIGILLDTGDSGWYISTRNGTTTTRVQIAAASGAAFLSTMSKSTTDVYDMYIFCAPNGASVNFWIKNATTDAVICNNYSTSTTLPSNTTFLGIHAAAQAGSSGVAQVLHINRIYLESDI